MLLHVTVVYFLLLLSITHLNGYTISEWAFGLLLVFGD